jgi:protocatechuate 3,4-dioxygenase beta subunit
MVTRTLLSVGTLAAPWLGASAALLAQVDADWLRMWTEAQAQRPAALSHAGRIAAPGEPGTPLVVHGLVLGLDETTPAADVVVFAYQTDEDGVYSGPGKPGKPWRLQGWARTGTDGRFEFATIRPGAYPGRTAPAHIHIILESAVHGRQWAPELRFDDDPLVSAEERRRSANDGRFGGVRPVRMQGGVAHVDFAVRLKPKGDF